LFDDALFIHPFEEILTADFFEFEINGKVKATQKDQNRANFTLDLLDLSNSTLVSMREQQYLAIIEQLDSGLDIPTFLDSTQAELPKFYSMLRQFFGKI
jgi:hypothetical protein